MGISREIYEIFTGIEKEYKNESLRWGNYLSQQDWNIIDNKVNVFIKNINKDTLRGDINRITTHELRDSAIIDIFKKTNIKTVLDIGADTGIFLARCKYNNIEGVGIEPNKKAVDYVNRKDFIKLFCFDLQSLIQKFENNNRFDVCTMLNTFHGVWKSIREKEDFTKYLSQNFRYAILSDDYKNNKPDPIIMRYFDLIYDFNKYGIASLRNYKNMPWLLKRYFKSFRKNPIYEKMNILSVHKLYISKGAV